MQTDDSGKRYGVVVYRDKDGPWYAVIDRQADSRKNIVHASRLAISARSRAAHLNAGRMVAGELTESATMREP